jgi:hypothetical protein
LNALESYLRFDLNIGAWSGTATANGIRPLNSIHTMFRRLRVLYGSLVIEDIQNYGALVRLLTNVAVEPDYAKAAGAITEGMGPDSLRATLHSDVVRGPATNGVGTSGAIIVPGITRQSVTANSLPSNVGHTVFSLGGTAVGSTTGSGSQTLNQGSGTNIRPHTYAITLCSGLLTQQKLIPLKWLANQLTIELELEEPAAFLVSGFTASLPVQGATNSATVAGFSDEFVPAQYKDVSAVSVGANTGILATLSADSGLTNVGYWLDNIYYVAEILEFDSTYDAAFYQGMLQGGVPIKFASWHGHTHVPVGSTSTLTIQERARSVKSAFTILRKRGDLNGSSASPTGNMLTGAYLCDPYWCYPGPQSTNDVWNESIDSIDEFQFRIGGRYFPSQPVKCSNGGAEPLIELQKALNVLGDYSIGSAITALNWFKPRGTFVMAQEFESSNGLELSGINAEELADLALVIKLNSTANWSATGDMYTSTFIHYDAMIIIRPNNVVELIQ